MDNMEKVNEYYSQIESVEGQDKANTLLGNHYFSEKKYDISFEYYNKINNLKDPKTIYGLAYSMHEVGKTLDKDENVNQGMSSKEMISESKKYFEKLKGTSFDSEGIYYTTLIYFYEKNYSEIINSLKNYDEKKMKKEYRSNMDLFLGKSYYEMKNYGKAREHYEKTYNKTQSKGDLYQLILVDSKIGDVEDIEKRFNEYKQKFPTDLNYKQKIYLLVGNTYYKANQLEKAKGTYTEYLKLYSDSKISENYITILVAEGSYRELVTYLTPQPRTPENIYLMGIGYLGLTEYDKAIKEFESVIAETHSTPIQKEKANYNLVKTNFASKKYNATINSAKKYLDNNTFKEYRLEVLDLEGLANFRLENYDKARKIFTKLGKSPKYKDYSEYQIAETYYNQGKYDKAFKGYNKLYTENKKGKYATKSLYWGINILYLQNKYQEVIDKSKEFNIEYPKSEYLADVNFYRADSYFKLNDTKNAAKTYIDLYQKTTDEKVKDKTARELTTLYYNIEDYKNANIWKEKISSSSEKIYLSALIYEKQGKSDLAIGEYQKIINDKDYGSRANFNLASNYYKEKNYDKAKIHYDNILQIENGQYKDTATYQLGQIYMSKKDYSKALRNFMKIELLYTESPLKEPSKLKIATIYEAQKEDEKAKKTYTEFYKDYPQSKYKGLVLEKLVVINLNEDKKDEAKKYYDELVKVNGEVAKTYESYFK
jgi:tetratricopeptide (TPR) repeat protein